MPIQFPSNFVESLEAVRNLQIPNLEIHQPPFKSVIDYAMQNEAIPQKFPRPGDHFVIADYLIDLPVIAVDLSTASENYGRVIGYACGNHWVIADSILELVDRIYSEKGMALFGK